MPQRILIVEDETISRKNLGMFLHEEGYDVNEAKDGAEALYLLNTFEFDLVVSDIRMPRVDGIAVVSHLRSISPDTPFIVLTAHPNDMMDLSKMPKADIMSKPVVLEALKSRIEQLLVETGSATVAQE